MAELKKAQDNIAKKMPDLFISYSRKDKDFVRRLDESLKSRGREAWVDCEDIRPTEDFMQAIYGAIEGVDTFVFCAHARPGCFGRLRPRDRSRGRAQ